jgi:hypothetical protein
VLPVDLPTTRKPIAVITLKNRTLSPVAELFIKNARAMAKTWVQEPRFGTDSGCNATGGGRCSSPPAGWTEEAA